MLFILPWKLCTQSTVAMTTCSVIYFGGRLFQSWLCVCDKYFPRYMRILRRKVLSHVFLILIGCFGLLPQSSPAPQSSGWGTDHLRCGRDQQKRQPSKILSASWVLHQSVAMATPTTSLAVYAYTHENDFCCLTVVSLTMEMAATPSVDSCFFYTSM